MKKENEKSSVRDYVKLIKNMPKYNSIFKNFSPRDVPTIVRIIASAMHSPNEKISTIGKGNGRIIIRKANGIPTYFRAFDNYKAPVFDALDMLGLKYRTGVEIHPISKLQADYIIIPLSEIRRLKFSKIFDESDLCSTE